MDKHVIKIFGPPGTGKTSNLIGHMAEEATYPGTILFLSYTKAAAIEAASRIIVNKVVPSTIHSLAFRMMNFNSGQVVDDSKLQELSRLTGVPIMSREDVDSQRQEGDEYLAVINYAAHRLIDVMDSYDAFGRPGGTQRFVMFETAYREWKEVNGYIDFDDMLERFLQVATPCDEYACVFLDEAQDLSPLLWGCFNKIVARTHRVYLAGDDDQAIYEWNGADPHGLADYPSHYTRVLEESYRVPIRVHWFMHEKILPQFRRRVMKRFAPVQREGSVIRYGSVQNFPFNDFRGEDLKVLTRDKFRQAEIARQLNADLIPYSVAGGHSPWTSRIAKQLRDGKPFEQISMSPNQREFYSHADLTEPVTIELSTIHQAKGKEAEHVMVDTSMTNSTLEALALNRDAELRVWYTACTRTKNQLYICGENPCL